MKKFLSALLLACLLLGSLSGLVGCGSIRSGEQLVSELERYGFASKCVPEAVFELTESWYATQSHIISAKALSKKTEGDSVLVTCEITSGNELATIAGRYVIYYDTTAADGSWNIYDAKEIDEDNRYVTLYLGGGWSSVADERFKGNTDIDEIFVNAGMAEIGTAAFSGCTSLKKVTFASDNTMIDMSPEIFAGCTSLKSVSLPKDMMYIYHDAFNGCTALSDFNFSGLDMLSVIDANAFKDCVSLEKVKIVSVRGNLLVNNAFNGCTSLKEVALAKTTEIVQPQAFIGCTALKKLTVASGNAVYKVEGRKLIEIASGNTVLEY